MATPRATPAAARPDAVSASWDAAPELLRARGLRWTPQRRALIALLSASSGHVTAIQLLEQVRALDPTTAPSTIYRTLDTLEEVGLVQHTHGADGREEYHLLPSGAHGHLFCERCGASVELPAVALGELTRRVRRDHGFHVEASHVTVGGLCASCAAAAADAET